MDLIPSGMMNATFESYMIRITSKSRIIYWIIIGLIVSGLAMLPFIYVDVAVRARGYFQSETSKQVIYSPVQGVVSFNSILLGKKYEKGDTLLKFDTKAIEAQLNAIERRISENYSAIKDLETLVGIANPADHYDPEDFLTGRYLSEYLNMEINWSTQQRKFNKTRDDHERNELLYHQEIIPVVDYQKSLYDYTQEQKALDRILISQKSIWQADLMTRRNEATSLSAEVKRLYEDLNNRIVTAPLAGEIIQSSDLQTGTMLYVNQKIAELSPRGELIAICFVSPKDIGMLNRDQKIRIQVDALNQNEWGLLDANIIDISDDMIVESSSSYYFRLRCRPELTYMELRNGVKADLKKGMSFTARIIVTRRTLFNLIFDKAGKWFNPYSVKTEQQS
jgi:multidrug resistance efflux pump